MTFRVGQKVVCVNAKTCWGKDWQAGRIKKGEVYTITAINYLFEEPHYHVAEIECNDLHWWHHSHFRPVQEQGMSILRSIAANPKQKIRELA